MTGKGFAFWFLAGAIAGLVGLALLIFASPGFPTTEPWDDVGPFTGMWAGGPFAPVVAESGGGDDPAAQDMENITFGDYADGTTLEAIGFDTATAWTVSSGKAAATMSYSGTSAIPNGDFEDYDPATDWGGSPSWNANLDYVSSGAKSLGGITCYPPCAGGGFALSHSKWHRMGGHIFHAGGNWSGLYSWTLAGSAKLYQLEIATNGEYSGPFMSSATGLFAFTSDHSGAGAGYVDEVFLYELTEANLTAVYDYGKTYTSYSVTVNSGQGQDSGVCLRLDSSGNGIYVYLSGQYIAGALTRGANVALKTAGAWSLSASATITYAEGASLEARENAVDKDVDVYYNEVKVVSSNADILDTFTGTIHGVCAMSDAATLSQFVLVE